MAIDEPLPNHDKSSKNKLAEDIEYYLLAVFILEALLKIIACGFFFHPGAYLRSFWNLLDFTVVVIGILSLPEVWDKDGKYMNIKALRAVRVLRPLKLISGVPSLQVVMMSIVRAMVPLLQVLFLTSFVIVIYAIIGLEFMVERSHYSCQNMQTKIFEEPAKACDHYIDKLFFVHGRECTANYTCQRYVPSINYGITSFDNIFLSMITVFQCITMEGWTDIMYNTFDIIDVNGYLWTVYYVSLVGLGSFFMLNLVLGVLSSEFAKEREKVENRRAFRKLRMEQHFDRVCESYEQWLSRGEELMIEEQVLQQTPRDSVDHRESKIIHESVIINPAVVFSKNNFKLRSKEDDTKKTQLLLYLKMLRFKTRKLIKHEAFFWLVIGMVSVNTVIVATDHYNQPDWLTDLQNWAEKLFILLFSLEILLKVFALSVKGYCKSTFNVFELIVVVLSIIEAVSPFKAGLSVLRCLRLLRIFKVTRYWSTLRNLVSSLMNAMNSILSLMFLLLLFILIAALLGMQLFAGRFDKLPNYPRTNFDTFPDSLLAVFQVITGEDWNTVMYNGMLSYDAPHNPIGVLISLYFLFLVIFGNYTLLNVFLAIAVDNLTNAEILTHDEVEEEAQRKDSIFRKTLSENPVLNTRALTFVNNIHTQMLEEEKQAQEKEVQETSFMNNLKISTPSSSLTSSAVQSPNLNILRSPPNLNALRSPNHNVLRSPRLSPRPAKKFEKVLLQNDQNNTLELGTETEKEVMSMKKYQDEIQKKWLKIVDYNSGQDYLNSDETDSGIGLKNVNFVTNPSDKSSEESEEDCESQIRQAGILNVLKVNVTERKRMQHTVAIVNKSALYVFKPTNKFRVFCHRVVNLRYFDGFMMIAILISSIALGLEDPRNDKADINKVLVYCDYFFTSVFGMEIFLKVIDCGFFLHKGAYLRDSWNKLDAFVFVCNLTSIILYSTEDDSSQMLFMVVKVLRVLRVLRPIKAIQKIKKLKTVFQCMVYSLKNVAFVLIITSLMLFIFACIGVQLFKGRFFYCTDRSKRTAEDCKGSYYLFTNASSVADNSPQIREREWNLHAFHFDNIVEAALTLYICSTGEGWQTAMHNAMDSTGYEQGPVDNSQPAMALFFIVFVVLFTFVIINIYIALIILTFQRQGEKEIEGGLDRNQRDCLQFVLNAKPRERFMPRNEHSLSFRVWFVVDSNPFDYFIMTLIVLNSLQLMIKFDTMSKEYESILLSLNIAFTVLFWIEAVLKIVAYRLNYFKDLWNLFDLAVILGSLLDIALTLAKTTFLDPTMFRLCRAARIIKLLRKGASIRIILWTFLQSFKALPYVAALIFLMFYVYAVVGMQLFAKIKFDGKNIHENNNFHNIYRALMLLFRCATGESWNSLMVACYSEALCDNSTNGMYCGNTWLSRAYFTSFIFFCMFLLLNLFVAVIMDNFEYLTRDSSILGPHHMDEFVRCWSEFDPLATGKIAHEKLCALMCHLPPPVGFGRKCPTTVAYKRLIRMNMPVNSDGTVSFYTTLLSLIRIGLDMYVKGNQFDNDQELKRVIRSLWPKIAAKTLDKFIPKPKSDEEELTVGKIYCIKLLVMNFRKSKETRNIQPPPPVTAPSPSMLERINSILPTFKRTNKNDYYDNRDVRRNVTFSGAQHEHRQARENRSQVRRQSSWSDLPTFFRLTSRDNSPVNNEKINDPNNNKQKNGSLTPNVHSPSSSLRGGGKDVHGPKPRNPVTRNSSLRTDSNGAVINQRLNGGQRRTQYDLKPFHPHYPPSQQPPVSSGYHYYARGHNSAPATPRGSSQGAIPLTLRNVEQRRREPNMHARRTISQPHKRVQNYPPVVEKGSPRYLDHHQDYHFPPPERGYYEDVQRYVNSQPNFHSDDRLDSRRLDNRGGVGLDNRNGAGGFPQYAASPQRNHKYHDGYRSDNNTRGGYHTFPREKQLFENKKSEDSYKRHDERHPPARGVGNGGVNNRQFPTMESGDMLNGAPSQQYFDKMISQIDSQIAIANNNGSNNKNYSMHNNNAEDEDNEWC